MKFLLTDISMQHSATDSQLLQATYVRGTLNKKSYVATRPDHILHYGDGIIPQACHVYDHTAFINSSGFFYRKKSNQTSLFCNKICEKSHIWSKQ